MDAARVTVCAPRGCLSSGAADNLPDAPAEGLSGSCCRMPRICAVCADLVQWVARGPPLSVANHSTIDSCCGCVTPEDKAPKCIGWTGRVGKIAVKWMLDAPRRRIHEAVPLER